MTTMLGWLCLVALLPIAQETLRKLGGEILEDRREGTSETWAISYSSSPGHVAAGLRKDAWVRG